MVESELKCREVFQNLSFKSSSNGFLVLLACKYGLIRLLGCMEKKDTPKLFIFVLLTFESMSEFGTCKCQSIKYIILSCTKIHRELITALNFPFLVIFWWSLKLNARNVFKILSLIWILYFRQIWS